MDAISTFHSLYVTNTNPLKCLNVVSAVPNVNNINIQEDRRYNVQKLADELDRFLPMLNSDKRDRPGGAGKTTTNEIGPAEPESHSCTVFFLSQIMNGLTTYVSSGRRNGKRMARGDRTAR